FDLAVVDSKMTVNREAEARALHIAEAAMNRTLREVGDGNGTNDFVTNGGAGSTFLCTAAGAATGSTGQYGIFSTGGGGAWPNRVWKFAGREWGGTSGAYYVTTQGDGTSPNNCVGNPPTIIVKASGCYPASDYATPSCPHFGTDAPAGVSRKTITA